MLLEPVDRLGVEVVGGLVEQKHVGLLKKQAAEGHTAALATREGRYLLVVGRTLQGVHGAFELRVDVPRVDGVEFILKLGLTGDEGVHLVGILENVGVAEAEVDGVKLGHEVHDGLHALAHDLDDGLVGVELRVLLEVADAITGREDDFALEVFVDAGDYLEKR